MLMQGLGLEAEIKLHTIRNLGGGRGGFSAPHLDTFTPSPEKDPVPILQYLGLFHYRSEERSCRERV